MAGPRQSVENLAEGAGALASLDMEALMQLLRR